MENKELFNREEQVEAMKILLEHYSKGVIEPLNMKCPICVVNKSNCTTCVWVIETGDTCKSITNLNKELYVCDVRDGYLKYKTTKKDIYKWRAKRRRQLRNWIKKYDYQL